MIPNHKGEIPVALLLLPFVSGILVGLNVLPDINIGLPSISLGVCSIIFILLNLKYNQFKLYKQRWIGGILISLILFLFGWTLTVRYNELRSPDHFSKFPAQHLVARINSEPALKNGLFRFTAAVETAVNNEKQISTSGTLLISIKDSSAKKLNYGDELLIPAKYASIDPPFNPAEFNYKSYLARKNIFYQAFLYPKQYTVLKKGSGNALIGWSNGLRRRLVEKLRQNMRDTDAYAVTAALVLGYKADLSSDILETYSKTGTVYVLTVSGAQVAIIYLVLFYLLSFLDRFKYGKIIKVIIIICVIWYYAMLTGFSAAVCRAALMLSFVLIGKTSRRYVNTLNILAVSAFILLFYDPFFVTEAGFQLSYLAVFGVTIIRPIVYRWFAFKNKIAGRLWSICSFSIAIQLAIFPLCALYFHQFPVYFLASSLLVILPAAIIMYGGVIFLVLPKTLLLSQALAWMLEKAAWLMNKVLAFMEHLPGAVIDKIWLNPVEYLLLYGVIISLLYFWYAKKLSGLKVGLACLLLACVSFSIKDFRQSATKSIAWLSLKKHPAIVFKNGNAGVIITDLKSTDKSFKYSIQPYLDSCQVNDVKICDLNSPFNIPWFRKRLGLIQFLNTRVFICDENFNESSPGEKLKTNFIYLTGNSSITLNSLSKKFDFQELVIDGSNSDAKITAWEKQLSADGITCKLLKRNKSFIWVSN